MLGGMHPFFNRKGANTMAYVHVFIMLIVSATGADGVQSKKVEVPMVDVDNRTIKLVGANYDEKASHNMVAKFVEVKPNAGREIEVTFIPSRSTSVDTKVYRNHEATIYNIIYYSIAWRNERRTPIGLIDWNEPQFEVIFTITKDAEKNVSDFSCWSLVSFKLLEPKKEQPKPANK
jgi:hypothetical protein